MIEALVFVAVAGLVLAAGIALGMLIVPRLERLSEHAEDPDAGDNPAEPADPARD